MSDQWRSRRRVLKHAGTVGMLGLCGCTTLTSDSPPSGRRVTDLSVTGLDSDPISVTATPTHPRITPEQTAQFEVTVTVQRDGPVILSFGNSIPFTAPQKSTPPGIWLLQSQDYERKSEQTWIPANTIPIPEMRKAVAGLTAGDTLTKEWFVWGDPDHVSFIEPGTYTFTTKTRVNESGEEGEELEWTLSLTVATGSPEE